MKNSNPTTFENSRELSFFSSLFFLASFSFLVSLLLPWQQQQHSCLLLFSSVLFSLSSFFLASFSPLAVVS